MSYTKHYLFDDDGVALEGDALDAAIALAKRHRHAERSRLEADEQGALRAVAEHAVKVKYTVGLSTPRTTRRAWSDNRACAHCGDVVRLPSDAALVVLPDKSHRVAHRGVCFVHALVAAQPAITTADRL